MRWEHLFDDLESQLEHELDAEEVDLLAEEERLRLGRLALSDRIRAMASSATPAAPLRLLLDDGTRVALSVGAVGRDWLAGEVVGAGGPDASCVVPMPAIAACFPDTAQAAASTAAAERGDGVGSLGARLGLAFVLRDLCRRRTALHIATPRERVHGTIDRVGRDHIDLAEHEPGTARRHQHVRAIRMLPFGQIMTVRF